MTCVICDTRPATEAGGRCHNCGQKIDSGRKRTAKRVPAYFLTYRGGVVGLFRVDGILKAEALRRSCDKLPKRNTVNLDRYCEGYNRGQIKQFKACVIRLCNL